jgi:acyl carrier protein
MDFVELFNGLAKLAKPLHKPENNATSLDQYVKELGLDSLDVVLTFMYLADVYGLDEEVSKSIPPTTLKEIQAFCEERGQCEYNSAEEAIEAVE